MNQGESRSSKKNKRPCEVVSSINVLAEEDIPPTEAQENETSQRK